MIKKILGVIGLSAAFIAGAQAQTYPDRPIRLIVPFATGGSVDIVGRLVAQKLDQALGQPVVVENRTGASGMIGSNLVAKADPDGYTLLANSSIHVIVPSLYPNITYDALNDFRPVTQITDVPLVLMVSPSIPASSIKELVEWGKSQPKGLSFASAGNGSATHLAGEVLKDATGVDMIHVPYKGSGAAMIDVMGGTVPMMFDALTAAMGPISSGKLKPLAVTSPQRSPALPDVPTFAELGYPQIDLSTWHGIWAPAKTPDAVVNTLSKELIRITNMPDVQERIRSLGGVPVGNTPEEFAAYNKSELEKWTAIVKKSGAVTD